jgi:hypothetical protein
MKEITLNKYIIAILKTTEVCDPNKYILGFSFDPYNKIFRIYFIIYEIAISVTE